MIPIFLILSDSKKTPYFPTPRRKKTANGSPKTVLKRIK